MLCFRDQNEQSRINKSVLPLHLKVHFQGFLSFNQHTSCSGSFLLPMDSVLNLSPLRNVEIFYFTNLWIV